MALLLYRRLSNEAILTPGTTVDIGTAIDLGEYRELHFVITVVAAGTGDAPQLVLKHAPVNEESAYLNFETPVVVSLSATGTTWFKVDSFTRWVCGFVSGTLNAEAIVTIDLIGKG